MAVQTAKDLGRLDRGNGRGRRNVSGLPGKSRTVSAFSGIHLWALNHLPLCQIAAGLTCILVGTIVLIQFSKPFQFLEGKVVPEIVRPGQDALIVWTITQPIKLCPGLLKRTIRDAEGAPFVMTNIPTKYIELRAGDTFARSIKIPEKMAPGPAIYSTDVAFKCNWFNEFLPITAHSPEVKFTVSAPGGFPASSKDD